jgi:hypothetical protein
MGPDGGSRPSAQPAGAGCERINDETMAARDTGRRPFGHVTCGTLSLEVGNSFL